MKTLLHAGLWIARKVLPRPVKRYLKKFWDPNQNLSLREAALLARSGSWPFGRLTSRGSRPGLFPSTYDVVCLGVFHWHFRHQRPQHIAAEFGRRGHRVFYVSLADDQTSELPAYRVESVALNVWHVRVTTNGLNLYTGGWGAADAAQIGETLRRLRADYHLSCAVLLVQFPSWAEIAIRAQSEFAWFLVYDCLDDWEHTPLLTAQTLASEQDLVKGADLMVVTSETLRSKWGQTREVILLRNAADYDFFSKPGASASLLQNGRPIAGYFGAIADWFDVQLLERVATRLSHIQFVLIGAVTTPAEPLLQLPNVVALGEKPFKLMPRYLSQFDVCLIPFRRNGLTEGTDPVKLYEYFSQGKPVVSTALPELRQYGDLVYLADDAESFAAAIDRALSEGEVDKAGRRIEIARSNTWTRRVADLERAISATHPRLSIVIVTYENLQYTRLCLTSLFRNTLVPNLEIIVVDNASKDGTVEYLRSLGERILLIANPTNLGFARAVNQGLRAASGDQLILLNNDVVLPNGWAPKLIRHLGDPEAGLVVSVTNFSGNESRIEVSYRSLERMEQFAREYTTARDGESFEIRVAAMYCVAMRRDVYEKVGPLDESFTIGLFEDDDYSNRVRQAGYRVICAEDSFVHHFGQASFKKLSSEEYESLWKRNQAIYERKWSKWSPHSSRQ